MLVKIFNSYFHFVDIIFIFLIQDSAVRFIGLLQAEHLGLSSTDFSLYMRGEPVLPSKFVSLFDYPSDIMSQIESLRKKFIECDAIEYNYGKFDENIRDFNRRVTQSVTDINELLNGSYSRFPYFEAVPSTTKVEKNEEKIIDIFDQSTTENEHLPEPLTPEVIPQQNIKQ